MTEEYMNQVLRVIKILKDPLSILPDPKIKVADFNVEEFNNTIINLKSILPNLILICTCQGLQNFDLKTMVNSSCSGLIDKSMSKSDIEKFLSKISFNPQNPDFSILFKSFAKEQKINIRLQKKYKYQNIITREDLLKFELGQEKKTILSDGISSINLAI
jgi:hypothetical protein